MDSIRRGAGRRAASRGWGRLLAVGVLAMLGALSVLVLEAAPASAAAPAGRTCSSHSREVTCHKHEGTRHDASPRSHRQPSSDPSERSHRGPSVQSHCSDERPACEASGGGSSGTPAPPSGGGVLAGGAVPPPPILPPPLGVVAVPVPRVPPLVQSVLPVPVPSLPSVSVSTILPLTPIPGRLTEALSRQAERQSSVLFFASALTLLGAAGLAAARRPTLA